MILTVFRSRLDPGAAAEYAQWAARISALAETMPGHLAHRSYTADDGERLTIVEFESEETHRAWAQHPEHMAAQRLGRERFYLDYRIQVCRVERDHAFRRE